MSKLHYCSIGSSIVEQVILFQNSKRSDDYIPIQKYYDKYKNSWYEHVKDYIDKTSFDSDFDWKLYRAVCSFNFSQANYLSNKNNWTTAGAFNRWVWRILCNWISNVKTSSYRSKRKPSVVCPVCGRRLTKIDEEHLKHYKTKSDLPKYVVWKNNIYQSKSTISDYVYCWGAFSQDKLKDMENGYEKNFRHEKTKVTWPWFVKNNIRGVLCPLTNNIVEKIDNNYLKNLPINIGRYAEVVSWTDFVENYSSQTLIESTVYSLEHDSLDMDINPRDIISKSKDSDVGVDFKDINDIIESIIEDDVDKNILRLIIEGYTDEDICDKLKIDRKDVILRKKNMKNLYDLENKLCEYTSC